MLNKVIVILFFISSAVGLYECNNMRKNKQKRIEYHKRLEQYKEGSDKVKDKAKRQSLWKESLDKKYDGKDDDISKRREDTYRYLEGFQ